MNLGFATGFPPSNSLSRRQRISIARAGRTEGAPSIFCRPLIQVGTEGLCFEFALAFWRSCFQPGEREWTGKRCVAAFSRKEACRIGPDLSAASSARGR